MLISVLSAVAEIERENIIEQTLNGRKEKARQGGWNGDFAPYGYYLKDKMFFYSGGRSRGYSINI
ncbi:recombinase family protein [Petroclostridium sp. X23]|uniref:recombinase family protein n=1 Tax=Petroclostridium sp. X23 TaxID=3045146 RepID=UPI0032C1A893